MARPGGRGPGIRFKLEISEAVMLRLIAALGTAVGGVLAGGVGLHHLGIM